MTEGLIPYGPYVLLASLGKGAAGAAYLARGYPGAAGVPTPFVLKQLHDHHLDMPDHVDRFLHEAQIAVCVESPHVARVFDVGEAEGSRYIALEYVPGWTFARLLVALARRGEGAPLPMVHALLAQAVRGLGALHAATTLDGQPLGAVHRDVSPKNVMVGDDGRVKVIDLGLTTSRIQGWQTAAGRIMGSPGYMAPEQIRGEVLDRRIDLYALGVIGWELVTAKRWIELEAPIDMLKAALTRAFVPPSAVRTGVPEAVDAVFAEAMAAARDRRLGTAADFVAALARGLPPAASEAELAEFLQDLLPETYEQRRARVNALLAQPLPEPPDGEDIAPTVVHVRRPGVRPEPEGTRVVPTRVVGAPLLGATRPPARATAKRAARAEPRRASPEPIPMTSLSGSAPFRARAKGRLPTLAAVPVALGVGFGLGAWFMRPDPVVLEPAHEVAPKLVLEPVAAPAPTVRAAPRPAPEPSRTPDAVAPPAVPPVGHERPVTKPRRVPPARALDPSPVSDPAGIAAALQRRAVRFKEALPETDPRRQQVDLLLARLAMLKAAGFGPDAEGQLDALSRALSRLESE